MSELTVLEDSERKRLDVMRLPAFEVHSLDGHVWRIWADGSIEGFGEDRTINNRLPGMIARSVFAGMVRAHDEGWTPPSKVSPPVAWPDQEKADE